MLLRAVVDAVPGTPVIAGGAGINIGSLAISTHSPSPELLAHLLGRCALGDQAAFARLYELTAAKLYGIARYCLQREGAAEEVVQDAYLRIWRNAGHYNPAKASALTWMISITRHCAIDLLRRGRHEQDWSGDSDWEDLPDDRAGPQDLLSSQQNAQALADCLSRLDPGQRQCLTLAYFSGASMMDLARDLAKPAGTVKSLVRRGLLKLRECLK